MNSRTKLLSVLLIATSLAIFSSCNKDDNPANNANPEIDMKELGYENSKIGYTGSDLHMEVEIIAEAGIDNIRVELHPEGEHEKGGSAFNDEDHWEVDTTFMEFTGLKNTTFHEHLEIPVHAETGSYHFHFVVTDLDGQQSDMEDELEVKNPDDEVAPEMNITSAPSNGQEFTNGETISISGSVGDDKALGGMYIGLARVDQNLADADVNATNTITLLHTHDFDSDAAHSFSASIEVGAEQDNNITPKDITGEIAWQSAEYYILVKCKDAFGGNWTISSRYPVVLTID